ncbi:hypothetical protein AMECASPLE_021071 [Ameca splendens]|uniref:G-protein coupled receptors family 1 profile domain-containing protein n=1 Tax=Ameca splendens TaxID=208324 RepID=A0ABV0ZPM7_9TELE
MSSREMCKVPPQLDALQVLILLFLFLPLSGDDDSREEGEDVNAAQGEVKVLICRFRLADTHTQTAIRPSSSSTLPEIMNTSNSTSCEPVHQPANMFFVFIYSLIFLVGLVLNGFTLRVYFCVAQRQASSSVTIYLKNLAASDFLISLCLPLRIINFSTKSTLIRQVYCNFGASAFYLNMYASILFMGYIAANR